MCTVNFLKFIFSREWNLKDKKNGFYINIEQKNFTK